MASAVDKQPAAARLAAVAAARCLPTATNRCQNSYTTSGDTTPQKVAVIRLLLLTGCRKSEILTLRWSDYREGHLFLRDSKTGPRTVWMSQPARSVLDGLDRIGQWVFPAARGKGPRNKGWLEGFWDTVRAEAGLRGVRLHDLRHTHASHAVMNGVPVPLVARLLGHSDVRTTLRYAHLGDREIEQAAERVGQAIAALLRT